MVRSFFISPNVRVGIVRNFSKKAVQMRAKKSGETSIDTKGMAPLYKPRSDNQQQYVNHLMDSRIPIVLGIGPAGSGKTPDLKLR
jgi:phosphate starvation-inducible protein PhoH